MPDETTSSALVLWKTVSVNVRFDGSLYALIICFPVGRPSENPGGEPRGSGLPFGISFFPAGGGLV